MKIKCVAPFAGGKRRLAPRIVELLGPHTRYYEPFVGGCSILPAKPRAEFESVNDANHNIVRVLRAMQQEPKALYDNLRCLPFCSDDFYFSRGWVAARSKNMGPPEEDIGTAFHQLVVWWMGPGGLAGTNKQPWFAQRHTKTGGDPAKRWASFVESFPALCERLERVEVQWQPWRAYAQRRCEDSKRCAYYVDPPYLDKTFRYSVDFASRDHDDLAEWLNRFREARVVVSYRDDPADPDRLTRLYPPGRWRRVEIEQSKNMGAASGGAARNVEVLLVNDLGH